MKLLLLATALWVCCSADTAALRTQSFIVDNAASGEDSSIVHLSNGEESSDAKIDCLVHELSQSGVGAAQIRRRGSAAFNDSVHIDNRRKRVHPLLIVYASASSHVQASMRAAQACHVPFSVRAGGHGAAGYALKVDGLTLDIRGLNHVQLRPPESPEKAAAGEELPTMTVGAGALFSEIYAELWPPTAATEAYFRQFNRSGVDYVPVGGGCPQVGISGFMLGGGWSFLSRSFGLAIDNLVSVRMVLADGRVVLLSEETAAQDAELNDLWWAARGAGGGNFGVATEFVITLQPIASPLLVGELCWPETSPAILRIMERWLDTFDRWPNWFNMDPAWLPIGGTDQRRFCLTTICNNEPGLCQQHVRNLTSAAGDEYPPVIDSVEAQPFLKWQTANLNVTDAQEGFLYLKSFTLSSEQFTLDMMTNLQNAIATSPTKKNLVLFHVGGGAIQSVAPDATAFPHRNLRVVLQIKAIWDDLADSQRLFDWIDSTAEKYVPADAGSYVNYIDRRLQNWAHKYYGDNLPRLLSLKRQVDPDFFFDFPQAIGHKDSSDKSSGTASRQTEIIIATIAAVLAVLLCAYAVLKKRRQRRIRLQSGDGNERLLVDPTTLPAHSL